ncbi:MAG: hypothetical protein BWY37_02204 [Firmicutes bacterium ADurb.Bin262]|nr:MAG: hypothetical protein BWY37_02204 [Firmicutes bacterium ADurb.Bin262]
MVGQQQFVAPFGQALEPVAAHGLHLLKSARGTGGPDVDFFFFIFQLFADHRRHGKFRGGSAPVARAVVEHRERQARLPVLLEFGLCRAKASHLLEGARVGARVQLGENVVAVDAVPLAQVEGNAVGAAPLQLACREADEVGVARNTRQRKAETEAVGDENILGSHAELTLEKAVAVENIPEQRLGRGGVDIAVLIAAARGHPAPLRDIFAQLFIQFGVILLHQFIAVGALEVEDILGVFFKQGEVGFERVRNILAYGRFQIPQP